jgi:hypothetical protein
LWGCAHIFGWTTRLMPEQGFEIASSMNYTQN